jgi:2-oxoglutarate ferredoxin oxidoreductase subunit gamma
MNQPSLEKFEPLVRPGGVVLINSSLIPHGLSRTDVDELMIPANDIARELGNVRSANIVALGAFVARSGLVDWNLLAGCVRTDFNLEAIERGRQAAAKPV